MAQQQTISPLHEVYLTKLNEVLNFEKALVAVFKKLAKAAFTDELGSALAPSSTYVDEHIQRLKLVIKLAGPAGVKQDKLAPALAMPDLKVISRKKSFINDITIVHTAMEIVHHKEMLYSVIHKVAESLEHEQSCSLLGQSLSEDKDTYGWMVQLLGNVILPEANAKDAVEAL